MNLAVLVVAKIIALLVTAGGVLVFAFTDTVDAALIAASAGVLNTALILFLDRRVKKVQKATPAGHFLPVRNTRGELVGYIARGEAQDDAPLLRRVGDPAPAHLDTMAQERENEK